MSSPTSTEDLELAIESRPSSPAADWCLISTTAILKPQGHGELEHQAGGTPRSAGLGNHAPRFDLSGEDVPGDH